jgi:polyhydroxybutyrate depolymerase
MRLIVKTATGSKTRRLLATALALVLACLTAPTGTARAQVLQTQERTVNVGGYPRDYLIHVPAGVSRPAPLVLVFHGGGGRGSGVMETSGMNDIADRQKFIAVYPNGIGRANGRGTWNVGLGDVGGSADDVAFVRAILRDVERSYPIDGRRIYATGESMGGIFSYRLACQMSETFAAIAPVGSTMVEPNCTPVSPVAVLHIQGSDDQNIPLYGGAGTMTGMGRTWPPPMAGISFWAQVDGCPGPETTHQDGPETTCQTFSGCRATVEFCVVNGSGHAWPGSRPLPWQLRFNIHVSETFPASERIWAFFAAHPKP